MDLISSRTIEITKLGMDGLIDRQQAISSNIANVMTPDYQRKEVAFESQLAEIIEREDFKDYISYEAYLSSPAVYLKVSVGKGMMTFEEILDVINYLLEGSLIS